MYSLGIDQGGTKTIAIVADDEGRILGKGISEGACHFFDGMPKAMAAVQKAATAALAEAKVAARDLAAISAGLAGANWPEEITALETELRALFPIENIRVYNDCLIAMRGGTANSHCAVICAGTGLNVAVRFGGGDPFVFNNYIEDLDQGARGLGARTLRAIFLSQIGALPPTKLTQIALSLFGLDDVDKLLLAYQRQKLSKPNQELRPLLFEAAAQSDSVATNIIREFALSISRYPIGAIQKQKVQIAEIDIVLSGGLFKARAMPWLEIISTEILRVAPKAKIVEAEYEPVVGAVLLVLDSKYRGEISASVMQNCRASAKKLNLLRVQSEE
jgi:N-acetylglucosamine kinase-like BadF-type ATPase